jgi:hypothetical protein
MQDVSLLQEADAAAFLLQTMAWDRDLAGNSKASLKGAFIQIMPLTWDSLLLPVMDKHPLAYDLTGSTSGQAARLAIQDLNA